MPSFAKNQAGAVIVLMTAPFLFVGLLGICFVEKTNQEQILVCPLLLRLYEYQRIERGFLFEEEKRQWRMGKGQKSLILLMNVVFTR